MLDDLRRFLDTMLPKLPAKGSLAEAFRYATARWTALSRYLGNGRLEISNNAVERAIRPLAIGRKNWTFAGSDEGGNRAATVYTLIESAKLNHIDPEAWLRDIIGCIASYPAKRIADLLPWNWTAPTGA